MSFVVLVAGWLAAVFSLFRVAAERSDNVVCILRLKLEIFFCFFSVALQRLRASAMNGRKKELQRKTLHRMKLKLNQKSEREKINQFYQQQQQQPMNWKKIN